MRGIASPEADLRPVTVGHPATTSSAVTSNHAVASATDELDADQARALLKALAEPIRLQVIEALGGGELCVCELTKHLGLAQSKLSFHLRVLKEAGLLADRQSGRWVYYRLRPEAIEQLRGWLAGLAAHCTTPAEPCC
ncbi:MAG: ArsR/SmtB family transcription factor [Cyanobium sp.]